jgi:DNA-binding response OmpR family regulator
MMTMRLKGQSILVVEHEPSVALELENEFKQAGAKVFSAARLRDALYLAEYPALAAAVVNVRMGRTGESTAAVCRRLSDLGIPFMFYTKFDSAEASSTWPEAPVVAKPAESAKVAETVAGLLPRGAALGAARLQ